MTVITLTYNPTASIVGNGVPNQVTAALRAGNSSWTIRTLDLPGLVNVGQFPNFYNPSSILQQNIAFNWPVRGGLNETIVVAPKRPMRGTVAISAVGIPISGPESNQVVAGLRGTYWNVNAVTAGIFGFDQYGGTVDTQGQYRYITAQFVNTNAWSALSEFATGYQHPNGHSKIIGWAIDGYPIYGPFGYQNPLNNNSLVVRMRSGYVLSTPVNRPPNQFLRVRGSQTKTDEITLWNPEAVWPGMILSGTAIGSPAKVLSKNVNVITLDRRVSLNNNDVLQGAWTPGIFTEDYVYESNPYVPQPLLPFDRPLDRHNGRYCVTPEYPEGTYAYFATVDNNGTPVYPYFLGNTLYGSLEVTPLPQTLPLTWITEAGDLGTLSQSVFYQLPLEAIVPNPTFDSSLEPVYYQLLSGDLPAGLQLIRTGSITGVPTSSPQTQRDVTSRFTIRAYTERFINGTAVVDQLSDRTFAITISGRGLPAWVTPPGLIGAYYDGSPIAPIQLSYVDPTGIATIRLAAGSLPPSLVLTETGTIEGVVLPTPIIDQPAGYDLTPESVYGYDFLIRSVSKNFQFTCEISDGVNSDLRTFEIFVQSRNALTADNDYITADDTLITADQSNNRVPFLINPVGSIGTVTHDNWFAYKFDAVDLDGQFIEYVISTQETPEDVWSLPPGLTLDPDTGWLYGYIPNLGESEITYKLAIRVRQKFDPTVISDYYFYTITTQSGLDRRIQWLTSSDLGTIDNGSTSLLQVRAENFSNVNLVYRLKPGSDSRLPQGLQLLDNGDIAGQVSFNTFAIDNGTTTFDATGRTPNPTTFDETFRFTVNAYSPLVQNTIYEITGITVIDPGIGYVNPTVTIGLPQGVNSIPAVVGPVTVTFGEITNVALINPGFGYRGQPSVIVTDTGPGLGAQLLADLEIAASGYLISADKEFTVRLNRKFNEPLQSIYITALTPEDDRQLVNNLLQNRTIFEPDLIFRSNDPNFGIARKVQYTHIYGLTASTVEEYAQSLYLNHYLKQLVLGPIRKAQARDNAGTVIYEVIYSEIIDNLVNDQGQSVSKEVTWPRPIDVGDTTITKVYPNSLINMRDQVISQIPNDPTVLPLWMTSAQQDGQQLGFVPAWVIAYVKPGTADQIIYNINRYYGQQLNKIDFTVDRYELDRLLSKNWDPIYDSTGGAWVPPSSSTTFDQDLHYRGQTSDGSTEIFTPGTGYAIGDIIKVNGTQLNGQNGVNDCYIRILDVGIAGDIRYFTLSGTANFLTSGQQFFAVSGTNIVGIGTGATFDLEIASGTPTIFDQNSLQFNQPVDMYSNTTRYNKYLVFPKRTILG